MSSDPFESGEMLNPILMLAADDSRIAELQNDVVKVLRERLACQSLHILEHKSPWLNLTHYASRLWKEISSITHRAVLATDRKGLAGRTT